jgi:hypothetical protein
MCVMPVLFATVELSDQNPRILPLALFAQQVVIVK